MKRIALTIVITLILLGGYTLVVTSLHRHFLFGPGPFAIGKLAVEHFVPRRGADTEKEQPYDENKAILVFLSVSFISTAFPIYLLLSMADASRRFKVRLP